MRKLYTIFILSLILLAILVTLSFMFFEKEKHLTLFYEIELKGELVGHIEIDRYKTEDKITYKSVTFRPKALLDKVTREKITFSRKDFRLERYTRECKDFGAAVKAFYVKNGPDSIDFLAVSGPRFSTISSIAPEEDEAVFDEASLLTFMPLVDKYDFIRGGAQLFSALCITPDLLPPVRGKIIFVPVRDEYASIGGITAKSRCIIVRAKTFPKMYLWVSKIGRRIVRMENRAMGLVIKEVRVPRKTVVESFVKPGKVYKSHQVLFPSDDIALAGTIDTPEKEGKLPGVLLVAGKAQYDRENAGLFTGISRKLAQNGYIVLRYDKRGTGKSQGDNATASIADDIKDTESAFRFLESHENVDTKRLFVITHAEASAYLSESDFLKHPRVRGVVMLSVTRPVLLQDFECKKIRSELQTLEMLDGNYPEALRALQVETLNLVKNSKSQYAFLLGKHVFVTRMRELLGFDPLDGFRKIDIPLIIIQGKKDLSASPDYVREIEKILTKLKLQQFSTVYFRGLGHFLGELVTVEKEADHYVVDPEVVGTIALWLNEKCANILEERQKDPSPGEGQG
ncbi:alpha/beta hydrolase family protein [Candidatus Omnitrophota bacterium]